MRNLYLLVVTLCVAACGRSKLVRDEVAVKRGGSVERWRLEWTSAPKDVCVPEDAMDVTCPCIGFAYGQRGSLDLVRHPSSGADERFALAPLFLYDQVPGYSGSPSESVDAVLQRWPVLPSDASVDDRTALGRKVRTREPTRVLRVGDYDHDGQATEFVLQVGTLPCGKRQAVVVGSSAANPRLHAFTSIAHPEAPLVLETEIWQALLKSTVVTAVEWRCGDHGGDTQTEVRITVTPNGFEGVRSKYECAPDDKRGKLLSSLRL